jgi:hypothetical protein
MAAIGAGHEVISSYRPTTPDGGRFLPHAWVKGTANFSLLIQAADRFFEFANHKHLPVGVLQSLGSQRHGLISLLRSGDFSRLLQKANDESRYYSDI